jgi:hypothetical protein
LVVLSSKAEDEMPVVAAAAIGAGGALLSSRSQSNAARSAANASQQATDAAIAEQRRQYDLARADQQPWLQTGGAALGQLGRLYGLNGSAGGMGQPQTQPMQHGGYGYGAQSPVLGAFQTDQSQQLNDLSTGAVPAMMSGGAQTMQPQGTPMATPGAVPGQPAAGGQYDTFWQSPDYQYRMNEQMRALTARNSALGIQDSGAAQLSALRASGNLASGEFNNYANRLSALAGVGQTAAQSNAQSGANFAGNVGNYLQNNAQNLSSSYAQQGQAQAGLWGSLAGIGSSVIGQRWPV